MEVSAGVFYTLVAVVVIETLVIVFGLLGLVRQRREVVSVGPISAISKVQSITAPQEGMARRISRFMSGTPAPVAGARPKWNGPGEGKQAWEVSVKNIKFEKQIGVGSCGKVWLANWLGSPVAVKTFNDDDFSSTDDIVFVVTKEITLMSTLHHPNIVMFLGACVTPPAMCLLLEYCVHGSLYDFLREEGKHKITIKMDLCVKFNIDIARGVKYLHDRCNIIQRDLKSRNVLIDESLNGKPLCVSETLCRTLFTVC